MALPTDSKARKNLPIVTGVLDYFREALLAVAEVSVLGNEKHNPGQPLHWSKEKSNDHADCCVRHLLERGTMDYSYGPDKPVRHSAAAAWRALANLQIEIENAAEQPKDYVAEQPVHDEPNDYESRRVMQHRVGGERWTTLGKYTEADVRYFLRHNIVVCRAEDAAEGNSWRAHWGGKMPCHPDQMVEVQFGGEKPWFTKNPASYWTWEWSGTPGHLNIVAWRLA